MSFPGAVTLPADLQAKINWLIAHGAPSPLMSLTPTGYPGAPDPAWTVSELVFSRPGKPEYRAEIPPFGETDQSVSMALIELQRKGLALGDPNILVPYGPPAPADAVPTVAIDAVVGAEDPQHPGWHYAVLATPIGSRHTDASGRAWECIAPIPSFFGLCWWRLAA